ncbi:hypothetical protein HanPSC8_Chr14g0595941 [Helianthus annuus]|nr:hypothetical protein HanPSC8_Chr14g0595941 [Helianthus annuus]
MFDLDFDYELIWIRVFHSTIVAEGFVATNQIHDHNFFENEFFCRKRDVLGGWCDSGSVFIADVV